MAPQLVQKEWSAHTRQDALNVLEGGHAPIFDAIILGGGISGAGLLRELARRGLSTLLVEQNDFASGTSSKSSKLIHGGLRYLEMMDFGLVFEALSERHWLIKTQPHLVHPIAFNLPIYDKSHAPPGMRPGWMIRAGLWLYDILSLFRSPFFHGSHTPKESAELFPGLLQTGLLATHYYSDAMMLDDEMVMESLFDAQTQGATALNYVHATHVSERSADGLFTVECEDKLSGKRFRAKAKEVISCLGPWTSRDEKLIPGGTGHKLKPSRGTHLVLPWEKLPVDQCVVLFAGDGRIVFVIPRKDLGAGAEKTIVGTTDAPESRDPSDVHAPKDDIEYLLGMLNRYFTNTKLTRGDLSSVYCGVRPLLDQTGKSEAKTSREHEIWRSKAGIVHMAGGKYTTFRRISIELADFTFPGTKNPNPHAPLSTPQEYEARFTGEKLWGRFTVGFLRWKLRHHSPVSLEDVVFRRLPLWLEGVELEAKTLDRVAEICAEELGWDRARIQKEKELLLSRIHLETAAIRG